MAANLHSRFCTTKTKVEPPSTEEGTVGEPPVESSGESSDEASVKVTELTEQVASLESKIKQDKDELLRAYAEMENVRSRAKKDVENARTYANQKFAKSLLDVADNLARAIDSVPRDVLEHEDTGVHLKAIYDGVMMTNTELVKVFSTNGIVSFGEVGEKFDPHRHEAMFNMPSPDLEAGSIAQVLKRGYMINDRVLRPAQVGTVAK